MACRTRQLLRRLLLLGMMGAISCILLSQRHDSVAVATPPLVRHTERSALLPYDPDWPEVYLLLQSKCAGCHRPETDESDYTTYESLMAAESMGDRVIVPGDPDASLFCEYVCWNAMEEADSDLPRRPEMPSDRHDWLTAGQQKTIIRWIQNGALDYRLPEGCNISPLTQRPLTEMDFPSAKQCEVCHPSQYEQWSRSMHHYAQHSPVYMAFQLTLMERTGGTLGTFCTRCHTQIGTALGENGSVRNVNRSRISMEGVTCVVCHRRAETHYKSNSRAPMEPGTMLEGCFYGPFEGSVSADENIASHRSAGNAYLRTSQFCGECHDVTSPEGVRLEEAFSEWQNSPAAKQGITCQQCHMGPTPGVPCLIEARPMGRVAVVPGVDPEDVPLRHLSDHTFTGPDYSMLPDTEFPEKLDWMYEVDYRDEASLTRYQQRTLNELREKNREQLRKADEARFQLMAVAAEVSVEAPATARVGRTSDVCVDVTNLISGHSLPTGFTAERQMWIEFIVRDSAGCIVFISGDLDDNGDLRDEHSRSVLTGAISHDRYLLNFQNKFIALSNKGTELPVVLSVNRHQLPISFVRPSAGPSQSFGRPGTFRIAKGSLPPLGTRGSTYPVRFENCGLHTLEVRLNFRHLPPTLFDHIGVPHLKPQLQIVVLDEFQCLIEVLPD